MRKYVLAIDPGNRESGICLIDSETYRPLWHGKVENESFLWELKFNPEHPVRRYLAERSLHLAIEMVASYGMPVGREVFETCVWIGRFHEFFRDSYGAVSNLVYRRDEKLAICHSPKANDSTIRQALVDRFAPGLKNYGKGTKKEPGWFYGFAADQWQAYAVGVTFLDSLLLEGF